MNVTAFDPELPSTTDTLTGLIDTVGRSSLVIVTVDVFTAPRDTPDGAERVRLNVSSASAAVSPSTVTLTCLEIWPAVNVTVPETAV